MVTFFVALALLIIGYFTYGAFVCKVFGRVDRQTPALAHNDGVDYIPMSTGRVFLIQLLNIAGLGPIFGAIGGALWGPSVYLWIVFGTIFAGGVHDFMSGMMSLRNDGESISEVTGKYLGSTVQTIMRIFAVVLLVLVGTVFMTGPAGLLAKEVGGLTFGGWTCVVLAYYFCATFLPVDKIIGKIYPLFGVCLIVMALGVAGGILFNSGTYTMPELWDGAANLHPKGDAMPIWPLMFITVACGACSGFHSTQSPLMARCLKDERYGRPVFYGAMVAEGIIALIWAMASVSYFHGTAGLAAAGAPAIVVDTVSRGLLGDFFGLFAVFGVIACAITSGDTAFRSARLTIADWFQINQVPFKSRLMLAVPLLAIGGVLSQMDFTIIWRYFSWSNQTLAAIVLWTGAAYLRKHDRFPWICVVPATFMTAVTTTYILQAPEGFGMSTSITYPVGIIFALVCLALYITKAHNKNIEIEAD